MLPQATAEIIDLGRRFPQSPLITAPRPGMSGISQNQSLKIRAPLPRRKMPRESTRRPLRSSQSSPERGRFYSMRAIACQGEDSRREVD